jgi:predicted permease
MVDADFRGATPWSLWFAYFLAVATTWTIGHLVTTRVFGRDVLVGIVGGISAAYSNVVLLGAPFILGIFGKEGFAVLSLIVSIHLPVMLMVSIILFELFGPKGDGHVHPLAVLKSFLAKLFSNPIIIGILAGLAWRLVRLPLPNLAGRLVDALADTAAPVALFAMGLSLRHFGISGNVRPALALSFLKLVLMPTLVLALAWLIGLPPLTAKVAVLAAALPSGINTYLIAAQFGTGQALSSNQMTLATGLAVVTTTFWVTVAERVFV